MGYSLSLVVCENVTLAGSLPHITAAFRFQYRQVVNSRILLHAMLALTFNIFNCMISVLILFVCRITLEQVLHDLSIMMPFVTTERILFCPKSFLALVYLVCMIMMVQRFASSAILSVI